MARGAWLISMRNNGRLGPREACKSEVHIFHVNRWGLAAKAMEMVKLTHGWL
ncbi:MAG: hypothetical protein AAF217_15655 [Pseudomonadota bacterium]